MTIEESIEYIKSKMCNNCSLHLGGGKCSDDCKVIEAIKALEQDKSKDMIEIIYSKESNMEFHKGDIVIVTVKHPDGSKIDTKDDMGIITKKETTKFGIDYTVHTCSSNYLYGDDQIRLATQEEKDAKLIDLMMK